MTALEEAAVEKAVDCVAAAVEAVVVLEQMGLLASRTAAVAVEMAVGVLALES